MNSAIALLWLPFLSCLVLAGIHAYLGLHVVERGVIFVDLSLAQLAALGTTVAYLIGYDLHSYPAYFYSIGFAWAGAILFSLTRFDKTKIPQEAFIGIVYVMSAALSILIADRSPEGAEHIKYILVGNLLAVTLPEILKLAALYSFVGLLYWFWRKPLAAISSDPEKAKQEGVSIRLWDFLFYGTFGIVVTASVAMAGVLLVFSFLIVPAVIAILFSDRHGMRLLIGWTISAIASLLGMIASYSFDTPTGATVVVLFGLVLITALLLRKILYKQKPMPG